jgi:hypothetical protein
MRMKPGVTPEQRPQRVRRGVSRDLRSPNQGDTACAESWDTSGGRTPLIIIDGLPPRVPGLRLRWYQCTTAPLSVTKRGAIASRPSRRDAMVGTFGSAHPLGDAPGCQRSQRHPHRPRREIVGSQRIIENFLALKRRCRRGPSSPPRPTPRCCRPPDRPRIRRRPARGGAPCRRRPRVPAPSWHGQGRAGRIVRWRISPS